MNSIVWTSLLAPEYKQDLEELLFLNPGQHRVRSAILEAIEKYGIPRVVVDQGRLRVKLSTGREVQTVFAMVDEGLRPTLAGAMVFTRLEPETVLLLHMAVAKDYADGERWGSRMLALRLVEKLREVAAQIKGVRTVRLILGRERVWNVAAGKPGTRLLRAND